MDIKSIKSKWRVYVPDFEIGGQNNRDLPAKEQVTVEVHALTYGEQQSYGEMMRLKGKPNRGGFKTNSADVNKRMFCDNVKNITNLTIDGAPLEDPLKLYEEGPPEMVNDIIEAIQSISKLEEGERKN